MNFIARFRWIFIALGAVMLLAIVGLGIGVAWLNSFVHSDAFRHEVETRASKELGGTVEIKQINVSIFSGVNLEGLATKLVTPQGTVVAQVESVSCSYSLAALLGRQLQLNGLTVTNPQIVLTQQSPSSITTPQPPDVAETGNPSPDQAQSGKTAPLQFSLDSAKIINGDLSVKDVAGATKADLQGIHVNANTSGFFAGKGITGSLSVATIALPKNLNLTDFSTQFTYLDGAVEAKPFAATVFSGKLTGDFKLDPASPSLLTVNATGIDMAQAGQAANPSSPTKLSGSLNLQSTWHSVETAQLYGEGDAQITGGKLEGVTILNELSTAFRLKEMSDPVLESVTVHFNVAKGTTRFSNLDVKSTIFEMTGYGVIDPQGGLSADMALILNPDAMNQIPRIATSAFTKNADGGGSIPFHLSGTVANPQSDAMTKLFIGGSKVNKTLEKTFNNLFK